MLPHDPDRTPPHVTSLKLEHWREPQQKPQHKLQCVMLQLPVLFDNTKALVVVLGMFNGRDEEKRRKGSKKACENKPHWLSINFMLTTCWMSRISGASASFCAHAGTNPITVSCC
jgi:hypothetical protein